MKLQNEFTVPATVDQAFAVLLDVERVAPCLPGAVLDGGDGETYTGAMTIKLGPVKSRYQGTVRIEQADESAHRAVMRAEATDGKGQGTAAATITTVMRGVPEGTRVEVETDLRVSGPAAQFGRGVMQDVSGKLMRQFADCLAEEMQARRRRGQRRGPGRRRRPTRRPVPTARRWDRVDADCRHRVPGDGRRPAPRRPRRGRRSRGRRDRAGAGRAAAGARAKVGRGPRPGRGLARRRPQAARSGRRRGARRSHRHRRLEEQELMSTEPGTQAVATTDGRRTGRRIVDLSMPVHADMNTFPRVPPPMLLVNETHEQFAERIGTKEYGRRHGHRALRRHPERPRRHPLRRAQAHRPRRRRPRDDPARVLRLATACCSTSRDAEPGHVITAAEIEAELDRSATRSRSATSSSSTPARAPTTTRSATRPTTPA